MPAAPTLPPFPYVTTISPGPRSGRQRGKKTGGRVIRRAWIATAVAAAWVVLSASAGAQAAPPRHPPLGAYSEPAPQLASEQAAASFVTKVASSAGLRKPVTPAQLRAGAVFHTTQTPVSASTRPATVPAKPTRQETLPVPGPAEHETDGRVPRHAADTAQPARQPERGLTPTPVALEAVAAVKAADVVDPGPAERAGAAYASDNLPDPRPWLAGVMGLALLALAGESIWRHRRRHSRHSA